MFKLKLPYFSQPRLCENKITNVEDSKNCIRTFFEELKNLLDRRFREPTACGTSVPATGCSSCRSARTGEAGEEASRSETTPSRQNRRY
jgi:hypothetical protein